MFFTYAWTASASFCAAEAVRVAVGACATLVASPLADVVVFAQRTWGIYGVDAISSRLIFMIGGVFVRFMVIIIPCLTMIVFVRFMIIGFVILWMLVFVWFVIVFVRFMVVIMLWFTIIVFVRCLAVIRWLVIRLRLGIYIMFGWLILVMFLLIYSG